MSGPTSRSQGGSLSRRLPLTNRADHAEGTHAACACGGATGRHEARPRTCVHTRSPMHKLATNEERVACNTPMLRMTARARRDGPLSQQQSSDENYAWIGERLGAGRRTDGRRDPVRRGRRGAVSERRLQQRSRRARCGCQDAGNSEERHDGRRAGVRRVAGTVAVGLR